MKNCTTMIDGYEIELAVDGDEHACWISLGMDSWSLAWVQTYPGSVGIAPETLKRIEAWATEQGYGQEDAQ